MLHKCDSPLKMRFLRKKSSLHINKSVQAKIAKTHSKILADGVLRKAIATKEQQQRKVFFLPIKEIKVLTLMSKDSVIILNDTFLYVHLKNSKKCVVSYDFQFYKYALPTDHFFKLYIDPVVCEYIHDSKSNSALFYKIFTNAVYRIIVHVLLTNCSSSVCDSKLVIAKAGKSFKIVHLLEPSFLPICLSDCFSRLYHCLTMHQHLPVETLEVVKNLSINVTENDTPVSSNYSYSIEVSFEVDMCSLLPLTENDISQYNLIANMVSNKLIQN